jgi:hypothetical protein
MSRSAVQTALMGTVAMVGLGILGVTSGCSDAPEPTPSGRRLSEVVNVPERSGNRPPVIDAVTLVPEKPRQGEPIDAKIKTSDPDDDGLRLDIKWLVNGRTLEGETQPRLRTGDFKKGDRIELEVVVSDGRLESAPTVVRTRIANRPPRLQGVAFSSNEARPGDPIIASLVASDPDGDTLRFTYSWYVNDRSTSERGESFDTTKVKRGDRVRVEVVASDGSDRTDPVRSADVVILNTPPQLTEVPTPQNVDGEVRYAFRGKDADGDKTLRYRLTEAPRGMKIDPISGELRWRPERTQGGSHPVEVVVEDAFGDGSALRFEVTVQVGAGSAPAAAR